MCSGFNTWYVPSSINESRSGSARWTNFKDGILDNFLRMNKCLGFAKYNLTFKSSIVSFNQRYSSKSWVYNRLIL